jgi:NDP-sugar pyrophosphorylase family protein
MTQLVFLVAGMSSRFGGNPKPLTKIGTNNETLIEYSVNQALTQNFTKIIFITNSKTENGFRKIFGNKYKNVDIEYVQQQYDVEKRIRPWGTTDAICQISRLFENKTESTSFILVNGDDIYGKNTFHKGFLMMRERNTNIIGGIKVIKTLPETGNVNRGIISVDIESNSVIGLKERLNISKAANPELHNEWANLNFIGLQSSILDKLNIILEEFKKENEGDQKIECLLPDSLNELFYNKELSMQFFEITDEIMGITNPGDEDIIREKILEKEKN